MIALSLQRAFCTLQKRYITPQRVRDHIERAGPPQPFVSNPPYRRTTMSMVPATLPLPGSAAALALGCACPVVDNHYGAGVPVADGQRAWWYNPECPLHYPSGIPLDDTKAGEGE